MLSGQPGQNWFLKTMAKFHLGKNIFCFMNKYKTRVDMTFEIVHGPFES